jgi:hypothetical protein
VRVIYELKEGKKERTLTFDQMKEEFFKEK